MVMNKFSFVLCGEGALFKHFLMRKKLIVNKKRPVNLELSSIKFPPMAIASLLHRISGIALFLLLPMMLFLLNKSLRSEPFFLETKILLTNPYYKLAVWAFSAVLIYHVIAGIRHLLMDMGFGEHLETGRRSAILVIVLSTILTIFLGIWIW